MNQNDQNICKLLLAIAGGTDAQSSRHDVIFKGAAATISRLTAERDRLASELEVSNAAHAATGRLLADTGRKMLGMKAALELWLAYADENLFDFDFGEPCDGDVVCYECQNSGCISLKIRETRAALATPAVSDADHRGST